MKFRPTTFIGLMEGTEMLADDFGESKVTIKKTQLLTTIKENRAKHEKEYTVALAGFQEKLAEECRLVLACHTENKPITNKSIVALELPQSHLREYDRVISMLEMSVAEDISISEGQFTQFVLDEWAWTRHFKTVASSYSR